MQFKIKIVFKIYIYNIYKNIINHQIKTYNQKMIVAELYIFLIVYNKIIHHNNNNQMNHAINHLKKLKIYFKILQYK